MLSIYHLYAVHLGVCVCVSARSCVSLHVFFKVTQCGCQVRIYPPLPGTWSGSLTASASPSASKVQTWQPHCTQSYDALTAWRLL